MPVPVSVVGVELPPDPDGDTDYHGRNRDPGQEGDAQRSTHQGAELPHELLLAGPEKKVDLENPGNADVN